MWAAGALAQGLVSRAGSGGGGRAGGLTVTTGAGAGAGAGGGGGGKAGAEPFTTAIQHGQGGGLKSKRRGGARKTKCIYNKKSDK